MDFSSDINEDLHSDLILLDDDQINEQAASAMLEERCAKIQMVGDPFLLMAAV